MDNTEKILLTGLNRFRQDADALAAHNELYDLTQKELIDQGLVDERIYENIYSAEEVVLEPDENDMIRVLADGIQIGYVKKTSCARVRKLLEDQAVLSITLQMHGGNYKIVLTEDDDYSLQRDTAGLFACLELTIREASVSQDPSKDHSSGFIDTTYALEERQDNQAQKGFAPLLTAAVLTAFYLVFSCLYWYFIKKNGYSVDARLGTMLSDRVLTIHLGAVAAGFLFHFIAMFSGKSLFPFLAALCYAASIIPAQHYAMYLAVQIFFCLIAGVKKRSGNGFLKALFFLAALAVPTIALLDHFQVIEFDIHERLGLSTILEEPGTDGEEDLDEDGSVFDDWDDYGSVYEDPDENGSVYEDLIWLDENGSVFEDWEDWDEDGSVYEDWEDWEDWDEDGSVYEDWDESGSVYEDMEEWDESGSVFEIPEDWALEEDDDSV